MISSISNLLNVPLNPDINSNTKKATGSASQVASNPSSSIMGFTPISPASIPSVSVASAADPQITSTQAVPWGDWMGVSAGFWGTIGNVNTPLKSARIFISEDGQNFTKMNEKNFDENDITSQWVGFDVELKKSAHEYSYYFELENTDGAITKSDVNKFVTSDLSPRFGDADLQITVGNNYIGATAVAWCWEPGKDAPAINGEIWVGTSPNNLTKLDINSTRDNEKGIVQFNLNSETPGLTLVPGQTYYTKVIITDAEGQKATSKINSFKAADFAPAFGQDGVQVEVGSDYLGATIMAYTQETGKDNPKITAKLLMGDTESNLTELPLTSTRGADGMVLFSINESTPGLSLKAGQTKFCKIKLTDEEGQTTLSNVKSFTTTDFAPAFGKDGVQIEVGKDYLGATIMAWVTEKGKDNPNITAKLLMGDNEANLTELPLSSTRGADGMVQFSINDKTPGLSLKAGQTKFCKIQITDEQGQSTTSSVSSFTVSDFAPSFGKDGVQVELGKEYLGATVMAWVEEKGKDNPNITAKLLIGENQSNLTQLPITASRNAEGMIIFGLNEKTQGFALEEAKTYFTKMIITDAEGQTSTSNICSFTTPTYSPKIDKKDLHLDPTSDAQGVTIWAKVGSSVSTGTLVWGTSPDSLSNVRQTIPNANGEVKFNLTGLNKNDKYYYRLTVVDSNNRTGDIAGDFNIDELVNNNPVSSKPVGYYGNGELKLSYSLTKPSNVTIWVRDLFSGRLVERKISEGMNGTSTGKNIVNLSLPELNKGSHAYIIDANGEKQKGKFMVN